MLRNTRGATLDGIGTQKKIEGLSGAASYTYMVLGGDGRTTCGVSKYRLGIRGAVVDVDEVVASRKHT